MSDALRIQQTLALELSEQFSSKVRLEQVAAAVALLDEGASVPFIARYRKERTGSLDDSQLRLLEERLRYLREMSERRRAILASIEEQGKLSPALAAQILPHKSTTPAAKPNWKTCICRLNPNAVAKGKSRLKRDCCRSPINS